MSVNQGSHQEAVRAYIRQANWQGRHITLEDIKRLPAERALSESFHVATLGRTLGRWGFEFGKGTRTQHLKEKDHVVVARQRYLQPSDAIGRQPRAPPCAQKYIWMNRISTRTIAMLSCGIRATRSWIQNPSGQGERLIIMDAITDQGWVEGARVVFTSTRNTGDYHGQMNGELFHQWFSEKLLPQIPERALIVMDNASYHNVLAGHSAPTAVCSKANIRTWLEANHIPCRDDCLKVELVEMLNKLAPAPSYVIDELAAQQGHEVVRTPPYHPELQPIETCWGVLKNEVARHGDFTMDNLKLPLERAFHKITAQTC